MVVFVLAVAASMAWAEEYEPLSDNSEEISAENIKYDYEMFYVGEPAHPDCTGELSFCVNLPPNADRVVVRRSRFHLRTIPVNRLLFTGVTVFDINEGESVFECSSTFSWGCYFRIDVKDSEGNFLKSPLYYTSDYMKPDDLQAIMDWVSSIDEVPANEFSITRDAVNLIIDAESEGSLSIFSTEGKRLFYEQEQSHFEIPLSVLKSKIIIARFTSNNETRTQKILLK